jgi:hypothetical protein
VVQDGHEHLGVENPAAGLDVIRRVLIALSQNLAGGSTSIDPVERIPGIMDRALGGSSCPFRTYQESLQAFARAIYELRLESGRCVKPAIPLGCGFYDPEGLYPNPPAYTINYTGRMTVYAQGDQPYPAGIPSSFGIDLVDVTLDPGLNGLPLVIDFYGAAGAKSEFAVQVVYLMDPGDGAQPRPVATQTLPLAVPTPANPDGHESLAISRIDTTKYNRLGLVISRSDAKERLGPSGTYTVVLHIAK